MYGDGMRNRKYIANEGQANTSVIQFLGSLGMAMSDMFLVEIRGNHVQSPITT